VSSRDVVDHESGQIGIYFAVDDYCILNSVPLLFGSFCHDRPVRSCKASREIQFVESYGTKIVWIFRSCSRFVIHRLVSSSSHGVKFYYII